MNQFLTLFSGLANFKVLKANHKNEPLRVLVVVAPERADLVLATDIPHREGDVLVVDSLNVEADGRDGSDDLTELQLVQNGSFTCCSLVDKNDAVLTGNWKSRQRKCDKFDENFVKNMF